MMQAPSAQFGLGVPAARINSTALIAAANICDTPVALVGRIQTYQISNGGANYHLGDIITMPGYGNGDAQWTVTAISNSVHNGQVTQLNMNNPGSNYTSGTGLPTGVGSGGGGGLTLNITCENSTEPSYTCNGIFDTAQTPQETIQQLCGAMAGTALYTGGQWEIFAGAWTTPILSLSESDLAGPIQYQPRSSARSVTNGIKGTYVSPVNSWQASDFPHVTSASYVAEDGGAPTWTDIQLPWTTSPSMAQRIATIALNDMRRQGVLTIPCKLTAYDGLPMDNIYFSFARFGWVNKTFRILNANLSMDESGNLTYNLQCKEADSGIYGWTIAQDFPPTVHGQPILPAPRQVFVLGSNTLGDVPDGPPVASYAISTSNLEAFYGLDEGSGSAATDASGNGNAGGWNGSQTGTSGYYSAGDGQTWAGTFDGTSDFVSVADGAGIAGAAALSISVWFKLASTRTFQTIISKAHSVAPWSAPYIALLIRVNNMSAMEIDVGNGATYSATSFPVSLSTGVWYHVVLTYGSGTLTAYLNGSSIGTSSAVSGNIDPASTPLLIGADYSASPVGDFFDGLIQGAALFTRVLSAAEVSALYLDPGAIPAVAGRYAVTNGAGLNAVAEVDPNGLAIIDFTQGQHLGKTAANIPYASGASIESLKPAQAGADVTAQNTAADTAKVNGTAAATVQGYAGRAGAAIDAGNVVVASAVDFSRSYTGKHLGNIADDAGSGRYASKNSGAYGISTVNASNQTLTQGIASGAVTNTVQATLASNATLAYHSPITVASIALQVSGGVVLIAFSGSFSADPNVNVTCSVLVQVYKNGTALGQSVTVGGIEGVNQGGSSSIAFTAPLVVDPNPGSSTNTYALVCNLQTNPTSSGGGANVYANGTSSGYLACELTTLNFKV
jgi:hypothetical protein